jgi:hypothetical protein
MQNLTEGLQIHNDLPIPKLTDEFFSPFMISENFKARLFSLSLGTHFIDISNNPDRPASKLSLY